MEMIDGYPDYMMESIKKVEAKREANLKKKVKAMSMKAREEILAKNHPDFMAESKHELALGVDKGQLMYNGFADLLECKSILDTSKVDLTQIDYDVDLLIIGGGGAGTVAALFAHENGVALDKILITTKLRHGDANTMIPETKAFMVNITRLDAKKHPEFTL